MQRFLFTILITLLATGLFAQMSSKPTEDKNATEPAQAVVQAGQLSNEQPSPTAETPMAPPAASTNGQPQQFDCLPGTLIPVKPSSMLFNCDYAGLLTLEDAALIAAIGKQLEEMTTAELVFVSVPSRGEMPLGEFSLELAKTWGIGKKEQDNGVLLIAVKDNLLEGKPGMIRIEVGYGLEGCLNDAKCGSILDNIALPPFIAQKDAAACSAALRDAYIYLAQEIAQEYKTKFDDSVPKVAMPKEPLDLVDWAMRMGNWLLWSCIGVGILMGIFSKRKINSHSTYSSGSVRSSGGNYYSQNSNSSNKNSHFGGGNFGGGGAER